MAHWHWFHKDGKSTLAPSKEFEMNEKQYLTFTDDIIKASERWQEVDRAERNDLNFEAFLEIKTSEMQLQRKIFAKIEKHSAERLQLLLSPYYVAFIKAWLHKHEDKQS